MSQISKLIIGRHELGSKRDNLELVDSTDCYVEIFIYTEKKGIQYKDVWNGWIDIQLDGVPVISFKETGPCHGVAGYISNRIEDLIVEGIRLGIAERLAVGKNVFPSPVNPQQVHNQLVKHARGLIKRSKARLYIGAQTPGRKAEYPLVHLNSYYKTLQPIWRIAKSDSKKSQMNPKLRKRWRQRIENSFEHKLPDDLIEWLNISHTERDKILLSRNDLTRAVFDCI